MQKPPDYCLGIGADICINPDMSRLDFETITPTRNKPARFAMQHKEAATTSM
tara:strand:- start:1093 stop:1248 length:156 start_codon:yes stop_codon:yes gene_type:complete